MPHSNSGFEKIIFSEKTSLFTLYEDCILCFLDNDLRITEYNPFAESFFKKSTHDKIENKKIWELFENFTYPMYQRNFSSPLSNHYPLLSQHHQLSDELGISWNLCPTLHPGQYIFMAQTYHQSSGDIATNALIKAKLEAEQGNQAKLDFLANMSHELRNSLNGILGMTQILSMRNLPADTQDYVKDIYQSGNHLLSLVSDMLDFAKLEAGQLTIASEPFNVRKVISDIVNQLSKQCSQRNLDLILDYCDDIPRQVLGDANRLRQIILNLVTNAMKFTLTGHILIAVEVIEKTDQQVILQFLIEDTGIGIPEDKLDSIFNRFAQVRKSDETRLKGSGLGLAIVKQLVEKMGGSIGVRSEIGHGATFWINLPFILQKHQIEMIAWNKRFPDLKILVADDNAKRAKVVLKQVFGNRNRAIKGKAVLEILRSASANNEAYDIVLIDDQIETSSSLTEIVNAIRLDKRLEKTMICGLIQEKNNIVYENLFFYEILKPLNPSGFLNDLAHAWERWQIDLDNKATQKSIQPKAINVLLIEDNMMSQKVANIMLKEFGCNVILASDGHEALDQIQQTTFDIIFLDIGLPDMTGYDLAKLILNSETKNRYAPIIALTAHALENEKNKCLDIGMSDVLIKPITFDSTRAILLKWTNEKNDIATIY